MAVEHEDVKCPGCDGIYFLQRLTLHQNVIVDRQVVEVPDEDAESSESPPPAAPPAEGDAPAAVPQRKMKRQIQESRHYEGVSPWNSQTYQCADCGTIVEVVERRRELPSGVQRIETELQAIKLGRT
jgi:hypothetical protein